MLSLHRGTILLASTFWMFTSAILYYIILGQIDWAALAQAWIAQREASGQQSMVEQPPGMMPNGQDMSTMESGPNNHGNFQGDSNFNRMWQPGLLFMFSKF